jgi:hypothetical protein
VTPAAVAPGRALCRTALPARCMRHVTPALQPPRRAAALREATSSEESAASRAARLGGCTACGGTSTSGAAGPSITTRSSALSWMVRSTGEPGGKLMVMRSSAESCTVESASEDMVGSFLPVGRCNHDARYGACAATGDQGVALLGPGALGPERATSGVPRQGTAYPGAVMTSEGRVPTRAQTCGSSPSVKS